MEELDMQTGPETDSPALINRDAPDAPPTDAAHVEAWNSRVTQAKAYFKPDFDRMRKAMRYATKGCGEDWPDGSYTANIIQRIIGQKVASLYAKNPRAVAKPRDRLEYQMWDGDQQTLIAAMEKLAAEPNDPTANALIADIQNAESNRKMTAKMGKTLEILFHYFLDEQQPSFKKQAKQLVRRTSVCGVGYVDLGYQRDMEREPTVSAGIADTQNRIDRIQTLLADASDEDLGEGDASLKDLQVMMEDLQEQEYIITREGLTFDFPRSTEVIVDPKCRQLDGFIGADWICREFHMTTDEVKDIYKVDVAAGEYKHYKAGADAASETKPADAEDKSNPLVCVRRIQDIKHGVYLTVADGYKGYLREPHAPDIARERFFSIHVLSFNDIEDEKAIYPLSDVDLIMDMQDEYNRSRQGLREHRRANRPKYVTVKGRLEDSDKEKLQNHPDNAIIELASLLQGEKVDSLLQPLRGIPIDPAQYDVNGLFDDVLRTVGAQEANIGGTSGATATESSIAEGSRVSSIASNVDDLDDFLTGLARDSGQIMLLEMDAATVREIVGPGAAWPEVSREEAAKELYLEVRVGSSGRPNKAAELANLERAAPVLLQIPGLSPLWLGRKYVDVLDDSNIDINDAIIEGLPSIIAQNQAAGSAQPATGDPETDPASQGRAGARNAPLGRREEPGPQPAYPAPQT